MGENANFSVHELIVKSGKEKLMYKYSSGCPPFMYSISRETAAVSPKKTFKKNVMALRSHLEWLKVKGGQSTLLCLYHPTNEFKRFIPLLDILDEQSDDTINIWKFDYSQTSSKKMLIKGFESTDILQGVENTILKQGYTTLGSDGCDSAYISQKGKIHFNIASFRRQPFLAHAAIIFSMIRKLSNFRNIRSEAFPMSNMNQLINEHLYSLFASYDRGRHSLLKKTSTGMIGELKILILPEDRNIEVNEMIKVCGMNYALTPKKKKKLVLNAPLDCRIPTHTKMFVLSWNVAGWVPDKLESLEFLFQKLNKDDMPDIVVIGLQEVVELKAKNITSFFN